MKNTFITGTLILIIANTISKLLGAIFKIPLTYILNEEGMAIFGTSMSVYQMVLSLIISGIPLALSRFTAEQYALGNYRILKKGIKASTLVLLILGALGSLVLFMFSDFFAVSMKDPAASFAIKIISPSVFFVAWGTVYKSYFQGLCNMIPTAISQVVEAFIRLIIGFLIAYKLKDFAIEVAAGGAISGITIGEIVATLLLYFIFLPSNKKLKPIGIDRRKRDIITAISSVALPLFLFTVISSLLNLLDVAIIRNSLLKITFDEISARRFLLKYSSYTTHFDNLLDTHRFTMDGSRWLYGAYSGYALTIFHLPTGIVGALGASILPQISQSLVVCDLKKTEKITTSSLKFTMILALPFALLFYMFSNELLRLLFNNTSSSILLKELAPCLVFLCISQVFTTILHASGKVFEPFLYSLIGTIIKLFVDFFLVRNPYINISGVPFGAFLCFLTVAILNIISVRKHLKIKFDFINSCIKPIVATALMGIIMRLLFSPMSIIFNNEILSLFVTVGVGGLAYLLMLYTVDAFKMEGKISKNSI